MSLCSKNRDTNRTLKSFLDEHNMHAITDEKQLEQIASQAIQENAKQAARYKTSPKKTLEVLHGQVYKKYYGRIHEDMMTEIFKRLLNKNE